MIAAVTFDLWDTLVVDDSDELDRARMGLPPKAAARRQLFREAAHRAAPGADLAAIDAAFDGMNHWFTDLWKRSHITPHIADRLRRGFAILGGGPGEGFSELVEAFASMEVTTPPRLCEGVRECLEALSGRYKVGIVSDAIVTPGTHLRRLLRHHGLMDYFQGMTFSDEIGASKPSPRVFEDIAMQLGVGVDQLVHVGDRESNDVAGPHGVGSRAILYVGAVDRGQEGSKADAICADLRALPRLIDGLNN